MEQRIGFGKRLGALCLDLVFVSVIAGVGGSTIGGMLGLASGAALGSTMSSAADSTAAAMAAMGGIFGALFGFIVAVFLIGCVYFLIEGFTGYTLGKLILGIRVASDDGTAAPVTKLLGRFAIKNIGYVLGLLAALTGVRVLGTLGNLGALIIFVGCFFVLGMKRQAFHDMIMGTAVYPKGAIKPS
ncbi:MAG: RDD family protein [Gemmatimonadales bacterium]